MPETNQFRVGDRVETRRSADVPEQWRQRRAEVRTVGTDGRMRLRFVNPPENLDWDQDAHGPRFLPEWVRLVERTLRCEIGGTVLVSDPAYLSVDEAAGNVSTVPARMYGATCKVIGNSGSAWQVQKIDDDGQVTGSGYYVHQNYLTVIEEAPPPKFEEGATVITHSPCYTSAEPSAHERYDAAFSGRVGVVGGRSVNGRWQVMLADGTPLNVHENWLDLYVDETVPSFSIGDVVRTDSEPRSYLGDGPTARRVADTEALIVNADGPRYLLRTHGGTEYWVHQNHLILVEFTYPEVGTPVQVRRYAVQRRESETAPFNHTLSSRVCAKYGAVTQSRTIKSNTKVRLDQGDEIACHPFFLLVLTPEEDEARIRPGQRYRIGLCEADDGSLPTPEFRGRVVTVGEFDGDERWMVTQAETGVSGYVHGSMLTRLSTVESDLSCFSCSEPVADGEDLELDGYFYCPSCLVECAGCDGVFQVNNYRVDVRHVDGDWQCTDCLPNCAHCGTSHPSSAMERDPHNSYHYCPSCRRACRSVGCMDTVFGGGTFCRGCSQYVGHGALGRWRSTAATMWLGGPVKRVGGYYMGSELEISASGEYNLRGTLDWAEAHLGSREALDLKPDGSVAGFEIATQPMTPAFFEQVDWESFFDVLNTSFPIRSEPNEHGLHVHIGRQAFRRVKVIRGASGRRREVMTTDHSMIAAFTFLLSRGSTHVQRISRRTPNHYCSDIVNPVKAAIHTSQELTSRQKYKISDDGTGRVPSHTAAVNLTNPVTIEIRSFKSTRSAQEFRDAHRLVYLAAEYIRYLRSQGTINPKALTWGRFSLWVAKVMPQAYPSISGLAGDIEPSSPEDMVALMAAFSTSASAAAALVSTPNLVNEVPEEGGAPFRGSPITWEDLIEDDSLLSVDE